MSNIVAVIVFEGRADLRLQIACKGKAVETQELLPRESFLQIE